MDVESLQDLCTDKILNSIHSSGLYSVLGSNIWSLRTNDDSLFKTTTLSARDLYAKLLFANPLLEMVIMSSLEKGTL